MLELLNKPVNEMNMVYIIGADTFAICDNIMLQNMAHEIVSKSDDYFTEKWMFEKIKYFKSDVIENVMRFIIGTDEVRFPKDTMIELAFKYGFVVLTIEDYKQELLERVDGLVYEERYGN